MIKNKFKPIVENNVKIYFNLIMSNKNDNNFFINKNIIIEFESRYGKKTSKLEFVINKINYELFLDNKINRFKCKDNKDKNKKNDKDDSKEENDNNEKKKNGKDSKDEKKNNILLKIEEKEENKENKKKLTLTTKNKNNDLKKLEIEILENCKELIDHIRKKEK